MLLCGCGNRNKPVENPIKEESETIDTAMVVEEVAADTLITESLMDEVDDSTTVRYLKALPAGYNEDDCFGLILDYGGYGMDVSAWPMPDGDWLITWHWCM